MQGIRPRLATLIFEVTQRCNHSCLHCYNVWHHPESRYPRGELDTQQTLSLLAKALDETDCQHVTLTGGEPLLRVDLNEILDLLQERGVSVTLISNGRLLTHGKVAELVDGGVSFFELPLLSYRREVHDSLSGSAGAFDAVLRAMTRIRTHQGAFVAVFVLTQVNFSDLYNTIKLAFAFGARGLILNRFNPGGRGVEHLEELLPSAQQVREALFIAERASVELGVPISCSVPIQPCLVDWNLQEAFPHLGFGFCAAGTPRAYYTLDPLGNLRPCNHTPVCLGNLLTESFSDLIASEQMESFTRAMPSSCRECAIRESCRGGCKAAAQACYGSLSAEDPFLYRNKPGDHHVENLQTFVSPFPDSLAPGVLR